jgi:transcriptional regulatory protein GAL4
MPDPTNEALTIHSNRYFLFQAGLVPIVCLARDPTNEDSAMWFNDVLITKDLLTQASFTNHLAARCLAVFQRLSPVFDTGVMDDLRSWEGLFAPGFPDDQFWDWANNEMNWTLDNPG